MKTLYLAVTMIVILLLGTNVAQAQDKKSSIEGAWQLVNARSMVGDKIMSEFPKNYNSNGVQSLQKMKSLKNFYKKILKWIKMP